METGWKQRETQGRTIYRNIGFHLGMRLGGRIADPNTESELEYADESLDHTSYFEVYAKLSIPEQATPKRPTDTPIVVPTPPINATFPCCLGCEVLNKPVTELVPIEEDHLVALPRNNQGQGTRMAMVCSGQRAHCGGHSDCRGYRGVACM